MSNTVILNHEVGRALPLMSYEEVSVKRLSEAEEYRIRRLFEKKARLITRLCELNQEEKDSIEQVVQVALKKLSVNQQINLVDEELKEFDLSIIPSF